MKFRKICGLVAVAAAAWLGAEAQYQGTPPIMGYQYNLYENTFDTGLFQFSASGDDTGLLWKDALAYKNNSASGKVMTSGWIRNGRLCGFVTDYPTPNREYYKYVERDLTTGSVLKEMDIDLSSDWTNFFLSVAYCPVDDQIYGYGFNSTRTGFAFKCAPASSLNQAYIIREVGNSYPGSLCYNHELGTLVGIMNTRDSENVYTNSFVSIDINTGRTSSIYTIDTDYLSDLKCTGGLIWIPSRHSYLWNFYNIGEEDGICSQLLELKPDNRTESVLRSFDEYMNFMYFVAEDNDPKAAENAPRPITGFQAQTNDSGASLSFILPSNLMNGSAISGPVAYTIYADNVLKTSGSGNPGESVSYSLSLGEGTHFIRILPAVNGISGVGEINSVFIGEGTPLAPENVVLTENELTWNPVVQGIAGNALRDVTYRVYVNDRKITETSETSLSMSGILLPDNVQTLYRAKVTAVSQGRESKEGYSNSVIVGKPWNVPFIVYPTSEQYDLMIQEDVDNNNVGWSFDTDTSSGYDVITSGFDREGNSDDWIFLPKFTVGPDKICSFSFTVFMADMALPGGKVQVWIGDAPSKSAMKKMIIPAIGIYEHNNYYSYSGEFVANGDLAGKELYIGIGVSSDRGILSPLRMYNMEVRESTSASIEGPDAVTDISVQTDENNFNNVSLTFRMPAKTLSGIGIPASGTVTAQITVPGMTVEPVTGTPGQIVTSNLNLGSGSHMIAITPSYNGIKGLSANCVVSHNVSLPGKVTNLRASYTLANTSLRLDWDAPQTDINGNSMEGEQLSYVVWAKNPESGDYEYATSVEYPLQYAVLEMDGIFSLYNLEIGITSKNSAGDSPEVAFILCQVGNPLSLPIEDDFNGDEFRNNPLTFYVLDPYDKYQIGWGNPNKGNWGLSGDMIGDVGDIICGIPAEAGAKSRIILPKVSTLGYDNISMEMFIWTGHDAAVTTVRCEYPSDEAIRLNDLNFYSVLETEVGEIPSGTGYQHLAFNLPSETSDQPWMSVLIDSDYPDLSSRLLLAGYKLTGTGSGVDDVPETIYGTIIGQKGKISIAGYEGEIIRVYTFDGSLVASAKAGSDIMDLPLTPGTYLVKVADRSAKVIVR